MVYTSLNRRTAASRVRPVRGMAAQSPNKFWSIKIARVLMKIAGFWTADTESERNLLNALLSYTLFAVGTALWTESCDFYFSMGDFYALTYTACSTMPVVLVLIKVSTFLYHRKAILSMLRYTQTHFWYADYDEFGRKVLDEAEKKGVTLISMFTFFVSGAVISYMMAPIIENIGKNETERILPFNIWLGIPLSTSPYFEIAFVFELIALTHSGLCFCCFDNFLGLLNIHAAAQFKILGHRLTEVFNAPREKLSGRYRDELVYEELKKCVDQHHFLIAYIKKLEHMFAYATACQLLISSVMICVAGFQVFLGTFMRRMIFIAHTNGSFFQLFVTTITANEVIIESRAVGDAAYNASWEGSSYETNKKIRTAILMIILRSSRPCCLTAAGFFPVSLETFMAVLSTATSYFTLLRKFDTDLENN